MTLDDMGSSVDPVTATTTQVLAYFADGSKVKFRWSFPHYNDFDYTLAPYGDIKSTASAVANPWARHGPIRPSARFRIRAGSTRC